MKKNAWVCSVGYTNGKYYNARMTIPAEAIREAGFNTKFPIYVQKVGENHFGFTQDGAEPDIVGKVNGFMVNKKQKMYQVGVTKLLDETIDQVTVVPSNSYIDVFGLTY